LQARACSASSTSFAARQDKTDPGGFFHRVMSMAARTVEATNGSATQGSATARRSLNRVGSTFTCVLLEGVAPDISGCFAASSSLLPL
jgi:hypothetical protein